MYCVGASALSAATTQIDLDTLRSLAPLLWGQTITFTNWAVGLFLAHGKEVAGLLVGSFGIFKWWYYREAVLHRRLEQYLEREDVRLRKARADALYTIAHPGERRRFTEPLFAVEPLRKILRSRNLDSRWSWQSPESAADRILTKAARDISKKTEVLEKAQNAYRDQTATAHIFKGIIAALRAQRESGKSTDYRMRALQEFRHAYAIPGTDHAIFAIEHIGHQLRCLGHWDASGNAYDEWKVLIEKQLAGKQRDMALAAALRWRSVAFQASTTGGSMNAYGGNGAGVIGALELREPHGPFQDWDAIDQGDLEYYAAYVASKLNFSIVCASRLTASETAYRSVITPSKPLWRLTGRKRLLAKAAIRGLERVANARQGLYDLEWLNYQPINHAPSHQTQPPAQPVGGG